MSRWWRAEDTSIDHPKLLRLSDAMHRAWYTLMCISSANGGYLPPVDDIALRLRMKPGQVAAWITHLVAAGLFDNDNGTFRPHNWNKRQYKTDVTDPTNAERQRRYRNAHRNGSNAVTDKRPETETETETETEQKQITEQKDRADAPRDIRSDLFDRGLKTLARLTGKGPDACRAFVGKCLKAASDDAVTVLGLIEEADRNRVVDPSAWIVARLRSPTWAGGKPLTAHQHKQATAMEVLDEIGSALRGGRGPEDSRSLRHNPGGRPESIRDGTGGNLISLPPSGYRSGG